jgi:hypothetical protein
MKARTHFQNRPTSQLHVRTRARKLGQIRQGFGAFTTLGSEAEVLAPDTLQHLMRQAAPDSAHRYAE